MTKRFGEVILPFNVMATSQAFNCPRWLSAILWVGSLSQPRGESGIPRIERERCLLAQPEVMV